MFGLRPWPSELECLVRGREFALAFHVQPDYQVGAGMSGVKPSGLSLDIWSEAVRSEVVWCPARGSPIWNDMSGLSDADHFGLGCLS